MSANTKLFAAVCPIPAITTLLVERLERLGFQHDPSARVAIVLDLPPGFALEYLRTPGPRQRRLIVLAWSSCPEYLEDLWDLRPHMLLAGARTLHELATSIALAAQGHRYRITPGLATALTPIERQVLQLIARGYSNQQIGARLGFQIQTVKNTIGAIYQKLGLKNRSAALLYYWGIWPGGSAGSPAPEQRPGG